MAKSVVAFSLNEFDPTYTRVLIGNAIFRGYIFTNLGTLEVITGVADFRFSKVKDLGNLTTINGNANFYDSKVESLGNLTTIGGYANFERSQVENLGNLTTIGGIANFSYSQIKSLGNLTTIEGDADFRWSQVKDLGKLKTIKGFVSFDNKELADQWKKISNKDNFKTGGQSLSKTPAPKKDRVYGSKKNKPESSKDTKSAEKIEFNEKTLETIKNKVAEHNEKNPKKKVTLASAKAVVRRGMGAYSSTHRPTISGGKPNSRVAWGLARLNAFFYKIINGKSKSGKYSQDDDLINELGYKVAKYVDGGDIQAYEEAMGISQFDEGGETKPKKVYVSITLDNKIEGDFPDYFWRYDEKTFKELKNGVLKGLVGVSTSPNNIAEWFIHRDCLIVMNYDEFMAINETEIINYYDPYQLMKNDLYLFRRLYANVTRYGEQNDSVNQTIKKILEKIVPEINLEMNLSQGQKYSELYRISRFLSPYETSAFPNWIENNRINIESPVDLTDAILEFNKYYDSYLGNGFENPVLTFDELLPIVEKGISRASSIYDSEQEIVLINRELNIPKNSQLFFINKDEVGRVKQSNKDELIEKYNLKELYKIYFVDRQQIQKYRDFWVKKEEEKFNKKLEKGREDLEFKKEQVLNELLNYFLEKSITYVKNELEKEIIEYNESLDFYDETDDNYVEQNLFSIPLVVSLMNTYVLIIKNFWKSFIQKKQVKDLNIYAFDMFYFNVKQELKNYFENNYDELEKLNNYRNIRGSGSLDPYRFERLLMKTIDDYENLPELIDYKELAKMYLDKMGREIYRYYDKKDLPLISKYKNGGETDEPTEFWGTEAGGVLIYCSTTQRYLILLRSEWVLEPNTWGIISGKLDDEENIKEAVLREAEEETGHKLGRLIPSYIFERPKFKFHNFISIVDEEFIPELNWENTDYKWVKINEMPENLHFGLKLLLEKGDIPKLVANNVYVEKYADGGLVGNTFTEIIYRAILSTENSTDIYAQGDDLGEIKSEYDSIMASDFDNPNSNYNSKILQSIINVYEFIGDDTLNAEDYIDDIENEDYWEFIEEYYEYLLSDNVKAINEVTDDYIYEIQTYINNEYVNDRYASSYMDIDVYADEEKENYLDKITIRVKDHSQNPANKKGSYNISFVIADANDTKHRWRSRDEYYFDSSDDIEDIKNEIQSIIEEKIQEVKEDYDF